MNECQTQRPDDDVHARQPHFCTFDSTLRCYKQYEQERKVALRHPHGRIRLNPRCSEFIVNRQQIARPPDEASAAIGRGLAERLLEGIDHENALEVADLILACLIETQDESFVARIILSNARFRAAPRVARLDTAMHTAGRGAKLINSTVLCHIRVCEILLCSRKCKAGIHFSFI